MRILLTGGGTGGHILPVLAVLQQLYKREGQKIELLYIGSGTDVEKTIMKNHDIPYARVLSGKWRRYFSIQNVIDIGIKLPIGILQALWKVWKFMPDAVLSKGGYVAIPVVVAAWIYRIPIIIHESDVVPGVANTISARFARVIALAFEETAKSFKKTNARIIVVGNPIREEILMGDSEAAKRFFEISDDMPVLLVAGGSQGAARLNNAVVRMLPELSKVMHVIHLAGEKNIKDVQESVVLLGDGVVRDRYHLYDFLGEEMNLAYTIANIVLTRAGAGTLNEIASRGIPSIVVPLENSANDHQRANAYYYVDYGASVVLEEGNLKENIVLEQIQQILGNPEKYQQMSASAFSIAQPQAADHLAELLIELVRETK